MFSLAYRWPVGLARLLLRMTSGIVSRNLACFRADGLLKNGGTQVVILDRACLEGEAEA